MRGNGEFPSGTRRPAVIGVLFGGSECLGADDGTRLQNNACRGKANRSEDQETINRRDTGTKPARAEPIHAPAVGQNTGLQLLRIAGNIHNVRPAVGSTTGLVGPGNIALDAEDEHAALVVGTDGSAE